MAGKRLVDAAKLLSGARGIVKQHIALRFQQLDVYSKTSTLAKAVKGQTDRVTVTAEAAYTLAKRLNETGPNYASAFSTQSQPPPSDEPVPRRDSVAGEGSKDGPSEGLAQDHHYRRQESNATREPVPQEKLAIKQEKPARYPLQDGTIPPKGAHLEGSPSDAGKDTFIGRGTPEPPKEPATTEADALHPIESGASTIPDPRQAETRRQSNLSPLDARKLQREAESQIPSIATGSQPEASAARDQDVFYGRPETASPELSSLPRMKVPKHAVDTQGSDTHLDDGQINQDVYYSSEGQKPAGQIPQQEAVPVQEEVPEGINTDVFYSPKISKMLGGQKSADEQVGLRMKGVSRTPIDNTELAQGKDQETFNVRASGAENPVDIQHQEDEAPELTIQHPDEDVKDLATAMAKDTESSRHITPEVCQILTRDFVNRSLLIADRLMSECHRGVEQVGRCSLSNA